MLARHMLPKEKDRHKRRKAGEKEQGRKRTYKRGKAGEKEEGR